MVKQTTIALLFAFLSICISVRTVFGNPIPWDNPLSGDVIQYLSIIAAEFCGLLSGTAVLIHERKVPWQKAILTVLIALALSYAIGIVIWGVGYIAGVLVFSPLNPFYMVNSWSQIIMLLPEVVGTLMGAVVIHMNQKTKWKKSLITMTAAMFTSFLVGLLVSTTILLRYI